MPAFPSRPFPPISTNARCRRIPAFPRRGKSLLANAGLSWGASPADIDERALQKNSGLSAPGEIASLLAREKACFVSSKKPGRHVVGADQTLALGNRLFSKPAGRTPAAEQ